MSYRYYLWENENGVVVMQFNSINDIKNIKLNFDFTIKDTVKHHYIKTNEEIQNYNEEEN